MYDLKALIQSMTTIPPVRQKLLGLVKGKLPPDEDTMCVGFVAFSLTETLLKRDKSLNSASLKLSNGKKFTLIGTPEGQELKERSRQFRAPWLVRFYYASVLTR